MPELSDSIVRTTFQTWTCIAADDGEKVLEDQIGNVEGEFKVAFADEETARLLATTLGPDAEAYRVAGIIRRPGKVPVYNYWEVRVRRPIPVIMREVGA